MLLAGGQMGVVAAGRLAQRLPGLDGDMAVGFRARGARITSAASISVSIFGRMPSTPGTLTVPFSLPRNSTSCPVFQPMPLPPLPSLSSSGPSAVKRA